MGAVFGRRTAVEVRIDDDGIWVKSSAELILDVLFDGRRIWSFWLHRDGVPLGGGHQVGWPSALRDFIDGTARITLTVHATGETIYDDEVSLGSGQGRIAIVSADGKPLALDKSLRRVQTFENRSAEHVQPLINAIGAVLEALSEAGVDAFIAYGTLLGAVRNGHLIGHDSDADLGYVSVHTHPVDVMRESFHLQRELVARGYQVSRYSGCAFKVDVRESDGSVRGLDVFGGFMMDGHLYLMGEIRTPFRPEWIRPLGTVTLEGQQFAAPADTDRVLTATYGPNWRVPDPAFIFNTPETTFRRLNGWFRGIRNERALWDRMYARDSGAPSTEPSDLLSWALERESVVHELIDVGCGRGSDVGWAARQGLSATGFDFVPKGFRTQSALAAESGTGAEFHYLNLLELRSVLSSSAYIAARPGPRVVMARHLVDAIGGPARANLWRAADMMLRDGGSLYLQFLTEAGEDDYARTTRVNPVSAQRIADQVRTAGGTIVAEVEQAVPSQGDDPDRSASKICRMVAQWDR